jgi:hypothetical protein
MDWENMTPKDMVRPLIAIMLVGTTCYMAIENKGITPQDIKELTLIALAFYFAAKAMNNKKES